MHQWHQIGVRYLTGVFTPIKGESTPQKSTNWDSPVSKVLLYLTFCFVFLSIESLSDDEVIVSRQAYAGLLWSKQFYYYVIDEWLKGDPSMPCPPPDRLKGRNSEWKYLHNKDVISMPDKWEYPWVCIAIFMHFKRFCHVPKLMHLTYWTGGCVNPRFAFVLALVCAKKTLGCFFSALN